MKFGIAKLAQSFYTSTEKSLNAKKKQKHQELSSIEDRKAKQIFVTKEKNCFLTLQIQCRRYHGPRGPCPPFWFTKNIFLEHYVTRKSTMMQKRVTFNLTYLTEVTYISSILKFLNTGSLVVQFSNTRFNIPSLHLWTWKAIKELG